MSALWRRVNSDQIDCLIIVNDVVKDERSTSGVNAQTLLYSEI
ncbi:MmpS family transport accessory protein [Mycobacterium uberis]